MGQLNENKGTREDLARYRITTAKEDLKAGQILLDADEYRGANNRAYYAIFRLFIRMCGIENRLKSA